MISVIKRQTIQTTSDCQWLRGTTSDYTWLRARLRATAGDYEWLRARLRVNTTDYESTSDYKSDYD